MKPSFHRFIENTDVVLELCEFLCHFGWNKSLLAFGSTCKALFEPAMDVLWCCLETIVNLLNVIPNFIQVDDHFVCDSISGNVFAYLIIECSLPMFYFRIAF